MIFNTRTQRVQHPHPAFSSWGEQTEAFVNKNAPHAGSYTAVDQHGVAFCGRVALDPTRPAIIVDLLPPLVVSSALIRGSE